jgi:hypothetical protein
MHNTQRAFLHFLQVAHKYILQMYNVIFYSALYKNEHGVKMAFFKNTIYKWNALMKFKLFFYWCYLPLLL